MGTVNTSISDNTIKEIAKGSDSSFNMLYADSKQAVFCIALAITKSIAKAEDISQDTYKKVLESAINYKGMGKPLAWVYTIARNTALSSIRNNKKDEVIDRFDDDIRLSTKINVEDKLILKAALSILNPIELEIVLLHTSGFKFREIASTLNIKISTALSKYNRSLDKMRKHLKGGEA